MSRPIPPHGTNARYQSKAAPCRCPDCRAAHATDWRRRRLRTLLNAVPRPTAAQLARQLGVTRATIMRDCRRLEVTLCEDARLTPRRTLLWRCRCGGVAPAPDGHPTCRDRAVG